MPHIVNELNFEELVLKSEVPVLLTFGGPGCTSCENIYPHLDGLAKDYPDRLAVAKIDSRENLSIATEYNIKTVPTTVVVKKGVFVGKLVGKADKRALLSLIAPHLD
jgi:thioredoxin 1